MEINNNRINKSQSDKNYRKQFEKYRENSLNDNNRVQAFVGSSYEPNYSQTTPISTPDENAKHIRDINNKLLDKIDTIQEQTMNKLDDVHRTIKEYKDQNKKFRITILLSVLPIIISIIALGWNIYIAYNPPDKKTYLPANKIQKSIFFLTISEEYHSQLENYQRNIDNSLKKS